MQSDSKKYLFDIRRASQLIAEFCSERSFEDYVADDMLKSAVERQFGIIGEALSRLTKADAPVASRITDSRRIIAFRNILVHGYATVDDRIVWGVIETNLSGLIESVELLLSEEPAK
jgi:uncharacterized protein with HEPN domain